MLYKKSKNEITEVNSRYCGKLKELYSGKEFGNSVSIVVGEDVKPTYGHYHLTSDEIYVCMEGDMTVETYEPDSKKRTETFLTKGESLFIGRNVHHRISKASTGCSFLTVTTPPWSEENEFSSDII